jgi:predicted XRE-type DNA-binding protein
MEIKFSFSELEYMKQSGLTQAQVDQVRECAVDAASDAMHDYIEDFAEDAEYNED